MALHDIAENIYDDAQRRIQDLIRGTGEYKKQRKRSFEATLMREYLKDPTEGVMGTRERLRELTFCPEDFNTIPPTK